MLPMPRYKGSDTTSSPSQPQWNESPSDPVSVGQGSEALSVSSFVLRLTPSLMPPLWLVRPATAILDASQDRKEVSNSRAHT